jgi:RNA polymerase sigma-70 factor (ECF subfamily)
MKHSRPSDVPSDVEPPSAGIPEPDPTVPMAIGVEAFVVSAYDAHHGEIFGFLARATRDPGLAETLLQETYHRLTRHARDRGVPLDVRGWLYRVATKLAIDGSRSQTTGRRRLAGNGRNEHERIDALSRNADAPGREGAGEIELALAGLSADARLALLLSGEGFSGEEIASAIDRSAAATRTLLCRARARVRVRRELFAEEAR